MRYAQKVERYIMLSDIDMKSRKQEHLFRRYYLINFLCEKTTMSMCAVARMFKKDHATIYNARKAVEQLQGDSYYSFVTSSEEEHFPMYLPFEGDYDGTIEPLMIAKSMAHMENQIFKSKY